MSTDNNDSLALKRLKLDLDQPGVTMNAEEMNPVLFSMADEDRLALLQYLRGRLTSGRNLRNMRLNRMMRIDRQISSWQKLDKNDSERQRKEDNTGRQFGIPMNVPVLASHLTDMSSYFAEALAPIQDPFATSSGNEDILKLTMALNKDALARDYYGEVVMAIRSLLKYNIGGLMVEWDEGGPESVAYTGTTRVGNIWTHLDPYNTFWDPAVIDPRLVSTHAEWAATVRLTNRIEMARKAVRGAWVGLDSLLKHDVGRHSHAGVDEIAQPELNLWRNPAGAIPTKDGQDSLTLGESAEEMHEATWESIGLGVGLESVDYTERPHELTTMYCWIAPAQFNIWNKEQRAEIESSGKDVDTYLELWRFEIIDGSHLVKMAPAIPPEEFKNEQVALIPMFLAHLTRDQLGEAQRSIMELLSGFQRFTSCMFSIYVQGMRSNVWGIKGYDPSMFDFSQLEKGEVAANLKSKVPGRDVRAGLMSLDGNAGVDNAMAAVQQTLGLKDQLYPSQALPAQIAGIDRAVTSQVTSVLHGAQRGMRMMLRLVDSSLMMPTRMAAVRNTMRDREQQIPELDDEEVARSLGSGIESIEAERITESLWKLLMGIVQNQEAMQFFDVSGLLDYMSRLLNLSTTLGQFARQAPPQAAAPAGPTPEAPMPDGATAGLPPAAMMPPGAEGL
jgi:hypothetical protein